MFNLFKKVTQIMNNTDIELQSNKTKFECRNAMYFRSHDGSRDDLLLIKEKVHLPTGEVKNNLRFIENFKKPVYIHKKAFQNYTQKRVWKPIEEMDVYMTTEYELEDTIKRALNMPVGSYKSRKQLFRSPYIYGCDISTSSIIRKAYKEKFPDAVSNATVAVLDIETNVVSVRNEIIAVSLSFKNKAIVATTKEFLGTTPLPKEQFYEKLDKLTPDVRKKRKVDVEFIIADTPALAIIEVFRRAHKWQPDYIVGWNLMAFDIPEILKNLEYEGYNPANILSDPSVPPKYRKCQYVKGTTTKVTSSGKETPLAGYEQWHYLDVPASFFFIDAMCSFYWIRKGAALEENYKLDTILNKYANISKLQIEETKHLDGVDKHRIEQSMHKIEYLVYNLWDCISLEILDETTNDLEKKFGVLLGVSDIANFTSNPKRLKDALHFYVQEDEKFKGVLGTASDQMSIDLDKDVPSLSGWIVALATERLIDNGLRMVEELPDYRTKAHAHSSDIDISSGYPNIEITMNVSKDTTYHELARIEGLTEDEWRIAGLNMLGGKVNSLSFAHTVYKLPKVDEVYQKWVESQKA